MRLPACLLIGPWRTLWHGSLDVCSWLYQVTNLMAVAEGSDALTQCSISTMLESDPTLPLCTAYSAACPRMLAQRWQLGSPHALSDELHEHEHHAGAIEGGVVLRDILQVKVQVARHMLSDHLQKQTLFFACDWPDFSSAGFSFCVGVCS